MKSLKVIQVLAKIGKILSKIIFVFCIVGFCIGVVGIVSLSLGLTTLQIGGVTLQSIIENKSAMSIPGVYTMLSVGIVFCVVEAVLCKYSERYFRHELEDGTPFTMRGAKELLRLGILVIVIPLAAGIICSIGVAAVSHFQPGIKKIPMKGFGSAGLGIMMIVTSLICRYGSELQESKNEETPVNE